MWRWIALGVVVIALVVFGFSLATVGGGEIDATAALDAGSPNSDGFRRAVGAWDWQFPRDHGAHDVFQTEWWYYTGNLAAADGRRFGFQFTIFRRALTPEEQRLVGAGGSEWRTNQVYLAHFTVSDIAGGRFYHDERLSRAGAGLAGATDEPYRVWLEDWTVESLNDDATRTQIQADAGAFAVDLTLDQIKPPALQGDGGLSAKSGDVGNASYYYSLTRLLTEGSIRIGEDTFQVSGASWMDHEFSTSALAGDAQGWDWFGLHLDDNRELMLGQIRHQDGGREPAFGGLFVAADGSTRYLPAETYTITATDQWISPHTGAEYPSGWTITVDIGEAAPLSLTLTPLMRDQELQTDITAYWEGAVEISGDATGYGYAELTGYVEAMAGRF